jgi:hypothetical protein
MRLTPKFVGALHLLKNHGYERVCSVVGAFKDTTYVKFWTIDALLRISEEYISVAGVAPTPQRGMWRGHANLRDMTDKDVRTSNVIRLAEEIAKREDVMLALGRCAWMDDMLHRANNDEGYAKKTLEKLGLRKPTVEPIL